VGNVLALEPRQEPEEGLDARQLGNLYHRLLEEVYRAVPVERRTDGEALKQALPDIAKSILDAAPAEEGFRATAWWQQTRLELEENVARTLESLSQIAGEFVPMIFEAGFFGSSALEVEKGGDRFRLHGLIDRVDRAPNGRVRIIDYKTAGPSKFVPPALEKGEKLQLPLYALAAREALGLGEVADGFYWHVRQAEASRLQLAAFGVEAAIESAMGYAWETVLAVRKGDFHPSPPAGGCPSYCPAASFCWQYEAPRSW
jgi:ATP-dependent helicase/DNAse subunit B